MRAQTMANVVPISIAPTPNLLYHNNVGVIYEGTSNFKIQPVRFIPLYFIAMFQSMVTVIEPPFITTPTHIIVGMRSRPQTPRGIELVSVHTEMPKEVNRIFGSQPLDLGGGRSSPLGPPRPLGPSRYFGLPIMNPSRPPLPPNKPYRRPLNYHEYVIDANLKAHVKVLKVAIKANGEINDAKIVNLFSFTFRDIVFDY